MIDPDHQLAVVRQAQLLDLLCSSVYYLPRATSVEDLALMRRINQLHLEHPFAGSRMMRVEALYRKPNTSPRRAAHPVYPYLLRNLPIERANQVWAMDITYVPMPRGFVCLAAVMDWASRRVLAWRVSISMNTDFCVEALEEALPGYGKPEIFNTDDLLPASSPAWNSTGSTKH